MQLEMVNINDLRNHPRNPRIHPDSAIDKLARSIQEYGWTNPVLVSADNYVLAGHARLKAAAKVGITQVPVVRLDLSGAKAEAYMIADNRLQEETKWDTDLLQGLLADFQEQQMFDLSITGFDESELMALLNKAGPITEDDFDGDKEARSIVEPVARAGDVWQLGVHRLACGDAENEADVARLLAGVTPILMATDPPYGVKYDPAWRARAGVNLNTQKLGKVANDDKDDWRGAWALFPGDVAYVWHSGVHAPAVAESLEACGFNICTQIIWRKDRFALSRGNYHWQHEPCWYAVRKDKKHNWTGDRKQATVWDIPAREDGGHGHGTQKPVECMARPIRNNSSPGQAVYDPFVGSGTTIIAAEQLGRACYAMELNPVYIDVAVKRWEQFTGKKAVRVHEGAAA